jgi:hypothetical protein
MRFRRSAVMTAGCGALVALAGCSSGTTIGAPTPAEATKPAATIFNDGIAAMRTAKSVHLKGPITGIQFDADLGGGNFNGTVNQAGKLFDIIYLAGAGGDPTKARIYLRATATVWTAESTAALGACVGDTWLSLDPATAGAGATTPQGAAQLTADAGQLGNLTGLADALAGSPGVLTKGAVSQVNGVSAVQVTSDAGGVLFVATDGPPVIVRITSTSTTAPPANLDFSQWNAGAQFSPPPNPKALTALLASCPGAATAPSAAPAASPSPTP